MKTIKSTLQLREIKFICENLPILKCESGDIFAMVLLIREITAVEDIISLAKMWNTRPLCFPDYKTLSGVHAHVAGQKYVGLRRQK